MSISDRFKQVYREMPSKPSSDKIPQPGHAERRTARRWKVFKKAWLIRESGLVPCAIRDITEGGARLQLPNNVTLPETFRIFIEGDDVTMTAQRVWSTLDQMGVRFTDRERGDPD